jgi:hypothetical protein
MYIRQKYYKLYGRNLAAILILFKVSKIGHFQVQQCEVANKLKNQYMNIVRTINQNYIILINNNFLNTTLPHYSAVKEYLKEKSY